MNYTISVEIWENTKSKNSNKYNSAIMREIRRTARESFKMEFECSINCHVIIILDLYVRSDVYNDNGHAPIFCYVCEGVTYKMYFEPFYAACYL